MLVTKHGASRGFPKSKDTPLHSWTNPWQPAWLFICYLRSCHQIILKIAKTWSRWRVAVAIYFVLYMIIFIIIYYIYTIMLYNILYIYIINPIGVIVISMNMTMLWSIYRNDHHGLLQSITILLVSQSPQGLKETLHGNTPRMYVCHICLPPQGKMLMIIRNQTWPGNWKSHEIPWNPLSKNGGFPWENHRFTRAFPMESQVSDPVPPLRPCCAGGVTTCAYCGGGGLMFGAVNVSGVFSWMFQKIGELVNQPYWKRKWTIKKAFDQWISMNDGCDSVQTWELLHL